MLDEKAAADEAVQVLGGGRRRDAGVPGELPGRPRAAVEQRQAERRAGLVGEESGELGELGGFVLMAPSSPRMLRRRRTADIVDLRNTCLASIVHDRRQADFVLEASACPRSRSTTSWRCPACRTPDPVAARPRPVVSVTTAPKGFEGEGFPVRRAFAGVDLRELDPFIHMDQMGEVDYAPGEPKGTPWHPHRGFETVTYMIDGEFEHQDSNGGGGVDHQRRHPVDDRRRRHPAHRDPAGAAGRQRRAVPRLPAVGEPAARRTSSPRRATRTSAAAQVGAAHLARRRRAAAGHRRRARRARRPGHRPTRRSPWSTRRSRPGASLDLPWRADFNALAYVLAGSGTVGAEGPPGGARASSPSSAPATPSPSTADAQQDSRHPDDGRAASSAASRSASRSWRTARS